MVNTSVRLVTTTHYESILSLSSKVEPGSKFIALADHLFSVTGTFRSQAVALMKLDRKSFD
jgi:hypothetical protein